MNSHWLRVLLYVLLVVLSLIARRRERARAADVDGVWSPFWYLTAGLLAAMAIGRAGDIGSLISDLGRGRANDSGWYESRRPLQAAVVVTLGVVWFVTVSVACWRTPERRRRYLPMSVMVFTLAAYAAVRVVSLHQIDAVLHRREIASVRVATIVEVILLVITAVVTLWVPAGRPVPPDGAPSRRPLGARS